MTEHTGIVTAAELHELTDNELNEVSGAFGQVIGGILAGIYGNWVYDSIKGEYKGVGSMVYDAWKPYLNK
jgi:hypothetical protein